jgi:hypothetical protein
MILMTHPLLSRLSAIACGVGVFLLTVAGLCGGNTTLCLAVIASDGLAALLWMLGACALGWVLLKWCRVEAAGMLRLATAGGLGLGIFSLVGLGLGLLGWLNRSVAICFPGVSFLLFIVDGLRGRGKTIDRKKINRWLAEPTGAAWLWLIPVMSLAIAAVSASILPGLLWRPLDPHPYDVTSYHLLVPREWYEGGKIVPLEHNVFSYFPFNVEMQFLLLMHAMGGPWAGMYACQFLSAGYAGLMVLAVGGVGANEHRTSTIEHRTSNGEGQFNSYLGAAIASVIPWTIMLAGVAYVESGLMLYTALSIAWAMKARADDPHGAGTNSFFRPMILSGLMAGFACGVKITAVPMLLLAVPTAAAVSLLGGKIRLKKILIGCGMLVLAGSIVLSPWLIRNFAWSGNPLFPIGMKYLGQDHFTNLQVQRFVTAHSPTPAQKSFASKLAVLWSGGIAHWQFGFIFFPLALIAVALGWRNRQMWLLLICGLFVLVVWIGFTHLLPRFLVMLIPIGGMAVGQLRWGRVWPVGAGLVPLCAGLGWSWMIPELLQRSNPSPMDGKSRPALIGIEDLSFMLEDTPLVSARDHKQQIALIGDAQAFLFQIPMKQMHYRCVFNLQAGDPIDAWAGASVKGDPDWLLVINPMEVGRLHRTYVGVPPLPENWARHEPDTFFMRGDEFKKGQEIPAK